MKNVLLLISILTNVCLYSQTKGVSPLSTANSQQSGINKNTYAVVVGISDYQDKDIPDLRFADKDAEAFANFLRSPAGGSLDADHLKVLTNEKATAGRIAEALDALIEQSVAGDEVIIYFSGHGDVEGKKISQPGFLLCWDAPARVYMGGGTYSLSFLQEVVTTLSVQNKAKVLVITDACHAGRLSGSQIGGAQLTAANLAKQYANEVKILSCQPNEFSLEGDQWGGGRGCFSYHLVDGLFGLADRNADGVVTVGEIDRYLEDHVTAEAAPQSQIPMTLGNKAERLAAVNAAILADLQKHKTTGSPVFTATESRGFEDEVLAKVDSSIREMYAAFKRAVQEKRFLEPAGNCAEDYYARLSRVEALSPLGGIMRRNYAAALQDDAQQVMNKWLKTDAAEIALSKKTKTDKYQSYPRQLERAAELLGMGHYMYTALQARARFFEGYLLALSNENPDAVLGEKALAQYRQALHWQPDLPQAYWQMSRVFSTNLRQPDSAEHYARRAMDLQPSWILPYTQVAFMFYKYKQFDRARFYLEQANKVDSSSIMLKCHWANYFYYRKEYKEAEQRFKACIQMDSTFKFAYNSLGLLCIDLHRYPEAEQYYFKAIQLDSTNAFFYSNLGIIFEETRRYDVAEKWFKKAIQLDSTLAAANYNLAVIYSDTRRYDEAERICKKMILVDSTVALFYITLGNAYMYTGRYAEAEQQFKKGIQLDSTDTYIYQTLGYYYLTTSRYTEAEQQFKKGIQLDSTDAKFQFFLGNVYYFTQRIAEAEQQYKKAIQLNPNFLDPINNLGVIYAESRRYAEAEQMYKRLIQLDSTLAVQNHILHNLGVMYRETGRYDEAEQILKKLIQLNSTDVDAYAQLGHIYFDTRRFNEAEVQYKKFIDLGSKDPYVYNNLGLIFKEIRQYAEAEQKFRKAIALDSANWMLYANLGVIHQNLRQWVESIAPIKKAIELGAPLARLYVVLANAYTHLPNQFSEARPLLDKVLEMEPTYPDTYIHLAQWFVRSNRPDHAWQYLEQGFEKGLHNGQLTFNDLLYEPDFEALRKETQWDALMMKYFAKHIYYNLACVQSLKGELDKAFASIELSLNKGWKDYYGIQQDPDLAPLRATTEWMALMKQHFPDKFKD